MTLRSHRGRGFTLLEVLVALVIVAFGMGALMATLTSAADSIGHLRDKSFAEWIALNRIAELRLGTAPSVGTATAEIDYAGGKWRRTQQVRKLDLAGILSMEVTVARIDAAGDKPGPILATAYGFLGGTIIRGTGYEPDWSGTQFKQQPPPGTPPGSVQGGGGGGVSNPNAPGPVPAPNPAPPTGRPGSRE